MIDFEAFRESISDQRKEFVINEKEDFKVRKETICISEQNLLFVIAGQLFYQAPNRQPRKAEIIMQKVRDLFRENAFHDNEIYFATIEKENLYEYIKKLLFSIPEFMELNLSHIEYENGISVEDDSRAKFVFHTRYDKVTSESWKSDFIDLDAFVQNVNKMLQVIIDSDCDCFLCIHQGKNAKSILECGTDEECKNCLVNPNLKNNYECRRYPKGDYTFACKFDCYRKFYICCEECEEKENCIHKCNEKSSNCGNAINRIKLD